MSVQSYLSTLFYKRIIVKYLGSNGKFTTFATQAYGNIMRNYRTNGLLSAGDYVGSGDLAFNNRFGGLTEFKVNYDNQNNILKC